jgi:hypothetical protein
MLGERPKLSLKVCGRTTAGDLQQPAADEADRLTQATNKDKAIPETAQTGPGNAVPEKENALPQLLTELAVERQRTVRRYLINERGIEARRVPECL